MGIKVNSFVEAFPKYYHNKLSHFPLLLVDYEIQMLGRWKSACYKTYVRSPLNKLIPTTKTLKIPSGQPVFPFVSLTANFTIYRKPYHLQLHFFGQL